MVLIREKRPSDAITGKSLKCGPGFAVLKRIEAAAIAAAVSPASSEPGLEVVIANAGRAMVMSSGRPQEEWSTLPSPTCEN